MQIKIILIYLTYEVRKVEKGLKGYKILDSFMNE